MPAIITITFNPAIDKSTTIPVLVPEKKMRCTPPVFEPGGGGINVARAINKLGGKATAVYLAGGYTGKFFTELLNREGIENIAIETARQTRENLVVLAEASNLQYRFGMPGPQIATAEWQQLCATIDNMEAVDFIIASGSLPPGVPVDIFAGIARIAKKKNAKYIVDTSGEALQRAANEGVFLLKPNLAELCSLSGVEVAEPEMIGSMAKALIHKGSCEVIVVSMGASGAMMVTADTILQVAAPVVKRKSTVGAGDSMVAGIVLSLSHGKTIKEAVAYGVACGTAATINDGTELCRKVDADRLYAMMEAGIG